MNLRSLTCSLLLAVLAGAVSVSTALADSPLVGKVKKIDGTEVDLGPQTDADVFLPELGAEAGSDNGLYDGQASDLAVGDDALDAAPAAGDGLPDTGADTGADLSASSDGSNRLAVSTANTGCACSAAGRGVGAPLGFVALFVIAAARRRTRRPR